MVHVFAGPSRTFAPRSTPSTVIPSRDGRIRAFRSESIEYVSSPSWLTASLKHAFLPELHNSISVPAWPGALAITQNKSIASTERRLVLDNSVTQNDASKGAKVLTPIGMS